VTKELNKFMRLVNLYEESTPEKISGIKVNQSMLDKIRDDVKALIIGEAVSVAGGGTKIMGCPVIVDPVVPDDEIWLIASEYPIPKLSPELQARIDDLFTDEGE